MLSFSLVETKNIFLKHFSSADKRKRKRKTFFLPNFYRMMRKFYNLLPMFKKHLTFVSGSILYNG